MSMRERIVFNSYLPNSRVVHLGVGVFRKLGLGQDWKPLSQVSGGNVVQGLGGGSSPLVHPLKHTPGTLPRQGSHYLLTFSLGLF